MKSENRADQLHCCVWVCYQKSPRQPLYDVFLGNEIKEVNLNLYFLSLHQAYCINSITGRVRSFGGLNVRNSFVFHFFNPQCFLTQHKKAMCHCWYRCGMLQFFKCFDIGLGNHLLRLTLVW